MRDTTTRLSAGEYVRARNCGVVMKLLSETVNGELLVSARSRKTRIVPISLPALEEIMLLEHDVLCELLLSFAVDWHCRKFRGEHVLSRHNERSIARIDLKPACCNSTSLGTSLAKSPEPGRRILQCSWGKTDHTREHLPNVHEESTAEQLMRVGGGVSNV